MKQSFMSIPLRPAIRFNPGSKSTNQLIFSRFTCCLVRIQLLVFVLNFLIQSHQTMACFIRIFRVLHTVQSSVFKVLFVCYCRSSNFYRISWLSVFVNHFFLFLQSFFIDHRCVLEENLPPFSAASYILPKVSTKVNNFFELFYFSRKTGFSKYSR